jgi:hypothetical protein
LGHVAMSYICKKTKQKKGGGKRDGWRKGREEERREGREKTKRTCVIDRDFGLEGGRG